MEKKEESNNTITLNDKIKQRYEWATCQTDTHSCDDVLDELYDSIEEDVRAFIKDLEDNQYSIKKKFWRDYENVVSFFKKFCKNRNQVAQFMEILDRIIIDEDHVSLDYIKVKAGKELVE